MTAESFLDAVDARAAGLVERLPVYAETLRRMLDGRDSWARGVEADILVTGIVADLDRAATAARTDLPRMSAALRAVLALCDLADADGSPGWIPMMPPNGVRATIAEHLGSPK